jgi:hypothetical protein
MMKAREFRGLFDMHGRVGGGRCDLEKEPYFKQPNLLKAFIGVIYQIR